MAQTGHLPIYKKAYDLCLYFEQIVRNFSRYHKPALSSASRIEGYSLGQELRDGARRVLKLIVRANARHEKASVLLEPREEVEELKVLLRLCHDAKAFASFHSFEHAVGLVTEIAKQNEGWLESQQQGRGPTGAGQNRRVTTPQPPPRQGGGEGEVSEPSVP